MRTLAAAALCSLAASAIAGEYVVRDACPAYSLARAGGDVLVRCVTGKPAYRIVGMCRGGPVEYWMRGGQLWIWCKGQPRPSAAR